MSAMSRLKLDILNLSVNFSRIGEWSLLYFDNRRKLIEKFISQSDELVRVIDGQKLPAKFERTWNDAKVEFVSFKSVWLKEKKRQLASERIMTWANILQHRSGNL